MTRCDGSSLPEVIRSYRLIQVARQVSVAKPASSLRLLAATKGARVAAAVHCRLVAASPTPYYGSERRGEERRKAQTTQSDERASLTFR